MNSHDFSNSKQIEAALERDALMLRQELSTAARLRIFEATEASIATRNGERLIGNTANLQRHQRWEVARFQQSRSRLWIGIGALAAVMTLAFVISQQATFPIHSPRLADSRNHADLNTSSDTTAGLFDSLEPILIAASDGSEDESYSFRSDLRISDISYDEVEQELAMLDTLILSTIGPGR
ncbi:MAG: hypothetical protein ACR2GY_12050 [Phycisphaerales bacterium]